MTRAALLPLVFNISVHFVLNAYPSAGRLAGGEWAPSGLSPGAGRPFLAATPGPSCGGSALAAGMRGRKWGTT